MPNQCSKTRSFSIYSYILSGLYTVFRATVVHRFIVRETIEERILATVAESGAEQWNDDCVTLQQMFKLFAGHEEMSLEISLMRQSTASVNVSHTVTSYSNSNPDNGVNQERPALVENSVSNQENDSNRGRPGLGTFGETSESDQGNSSIQGSSARVSFSETNDSIRNNQESSSLVRFGDSNDLDRDSSLINGRPALVTFVNIEEERGISVNSK